MKQDVHGVLNTILKGNKGYLTTYTLLEKYPQVGMKDSYLICLGRLTKVIFLGIRKSNRENIPCIIREYKNSQIVILLPFIYFFKKKLLFLINHNFAHDPKLKLHQFLDTLGIQFFTIDNSKLNSNDEKSFKNIMNIDSEIIVKKINNKKKEVVIFSKNYKEILQKNTFEGYTVLIPNRNATSNQEIGQNLISYGTQSQDAYLKMLEQAEIVVIDYDKKEYFYRTSGLIWDCMAHNNFTIVNNYLVFKNQLENYDKKTFYDSVDEIANYKAILKS